MEDNVWLETEVIMPRDRTRVLCYSKVCQTIICCWYRDREDCFEDEYTGDYITHVSHWCNAPTPPL